MWSGIRCSRKKNRKRTSKQSPPRLKQRVHSTVTTFKYVPSLALGVCDEVAYKSSQLRLVLNASVCLLHSLLNSNFWMLCHILHLQKGTDCQLGETEVLLIQICKSSVIVQLYLFNTLIISLSVGHRIIYFFLIQGLGSQLFLTVKQI